MDFSQTSQEFRQVPNQESQTVPISAFQTVTLLYYGAESELIHSISTLRAYMHRECAYMHVDPL